MTTIDETCGAQDLDDLKKALPGVDVDAFLKRVMGEREILFAVLNDVYDEEADTPVKLFRALAANNNEGVRMEAHRLKGMAANISAENLRAAAAALEMASKSGEGDLCLLLHHTVRELYPLLESLKNLQENSR